MNGLPMALPLPGLAGALVTVAGGMFWSKGTKHRLLSQDSPGHLLCLSSIATRLRDEGNRLKQHAVWGEQGGSLDESRCPKAWLKRPRATRG
ncbi:mCG148238 [Mus musculus]|nr:mCG148238 [Mus musculus]